MTDIYAYIWLKHQYTAINKQTNDYIPILTEKVNKCKSFEDLLICEHTEPARKIKSHHTCETRFVMSESQPDHSECSIKITRL